MNSADLHKTFHRSDWKAVLGWCYGVNSGCPCLQRLGTSTKRADFLKEQSMEGSRLFKDVRSVRVLLVAVVTRLLRTDTIVFFSVWVPNTLKLRLWMTHAFTVSV